MNRRSVPEQLAARSRFVRTTAALPDARQHDHGGEIFAEQEVFVSSEEEQVPLCQSLANPVIGSSAPTDGDHMLCRAAVLLQTTNECERKILVEKNSYDAWRTAGGRWAATCAA